MKNQFLKSKILYSLFLLFPLISFAQPQLDVSLEKKMQTANKAPKVEVIHSSFIYEKADFPECHASSIVELSNGKMMATWFGGTEEKDPDVTIWTATFDNGKWSPVREVADGIQNENLRYPCWNPVLYNHSSGKLFLFYKVGPTPRNWWGEMKYSYDDGKTWSYAERIPKGNLGPIRAKPIELENGDLLCPSSWEYSHGNWKAHMEVYQPKTNFWKKIAIDPNTEFDVIQPTILQYGDSKMQILCRSQQNKIVEAWSEDNGKTWGKLKATNLPNPSAGVDAVTLPDGNQLLIYNPTEKSRNSRAKLNLAISKDGVNWEDIYKLENEAKGEFSYPAMIVDKNGQIQITYTWNREKIKHVVLKLKS